MRRRRQERETSQRSVSYALDFFGEDPIIRGHADYFRGMYTHMFLEDVGLLLIPTARGPKSQFKASLRPENQNVEELVSEALSRRSYRGSLDDSLHSFVRDLAELLVAYSEVVCEIAYLRDRGDPRPVAFELVPIAPPTLFRRKGKFYQYIPPQIAESHTGEGAFVPLPDESLVVFTLPREYRRSLWSTMEELMDLANRIIPDFALKPGDGPQRIPYDSSQHFRSQHVAVAAATKALGWNARGLFSDDTLEYYELHRQLRFERFKIALREGILTTLNSTLERVGRELGFSAKLHIEGLPIHSDVERADEMLASGSGTFRDVLEPFL